MDPVHQKAGSSFHCQGHTQAFRLTDNCSTLQTELVAIYQALHHAKGQEHGHVVIHSDSKSSLQALRHKKPIDNVNLITSILGQLQWFQQQGRQVTLNWIPSHVGIPGKEWADEAAKAALRFREIQVQVPLSISQVKNGIRQ